MGKKALGSTYAAWLQAGGEYVVGKPAAVTAVVVAKGEYKCNDNYPYKFKVGAVPAGVSFASMTARGTAKGKRRTAVSVPFTASTPGPKKISGTFYFSVCNESTCVVDKRPMSVTVNVVAADES